MIVYSSLNTSSLSDKSYQNQNNNNNFWHFALHKEVLVVITREKDREMTILKAWGKCFDYLLKG